MNSVFLRVVVSMGVGLAAAASLEACASLGGTGSSSSSSSSGYRGTVTVTNQSGLRVCSFEPDAHIERHGQISTEIAPGASATFTADRDIIRFEAMECGTNRLLFGDPLAYMNDHQTHQGPMAGGHVTLLAPGASADAGDGGWSFAVEPLDPERALRHFGIACMSRRGVPDGYAFMQDANLAREGITLLNAATRAAGWTERYTFAAVVSDDWTPITERRMGSMGWSMVTVGRRVTMMAGARHQTGACSMRGHDLVQPFDGQSVTGTTRLGGLGPVFQIPCALLDAAATFPGGATER